jgi:predicted Zn-ribbon and HTH transcriptional regulator
MGSRAVCTACGFSYVSQLPLEVAVNPVRCWACGSEMAVRPRIGIRREMIEAAAEHDGDGTIAV